MSARVYADHVAGYAQAGWPCILPVPAAEKYPPPVGFTGAGGRDTDVMQLVAWAGSHAGHSIALRMPPDVIGIDVDHYDKGTVEKRGADTLAELEQRWGPLPPTWSSTARGSDSGPGPSRILFFRVPAQRYTTKLGPDIEVIQRHHRYAVVAPSPHNAVGAAYRWYDPASVPSATVPKPDEFAELPPAWVEGLREGATEAGPAAADAESGQVLLHQLLSDTRPACAEVTNAGLLGVGELTKADAGSRHDTATARLHHLVQLAAAGHPGIGVVVEQLRGHWAQLTAGEDRGDEFERMLLTSARKAVTALGGTQQVPHDPCLLFGAVTWSAPAPGDDRPGAPAAEYVAPWSIRQLIGAELFDPRADLDQTLAAEVLVRMYPALRYAHDAASWLLRGPDRWDLRGDLAGWAVAELATMMPYGDTKADPGSDDRRRADRRRRLMTAAGANAVAGKMKALVSSGYHPMALRLDHLDADPEILWAGAMAWDLRGSADGVRPAQIPPDTPHLHTAGFTPQERPTPLWDAFTAAVWPDPEVRAWALRVLSVAVTGYPDAALPILLGPTRRGKSAVVALLMSALGTYAHAADPRLLGGNENGHASIVFALKGRRLSFIDEGPRDGRWAQERLKQLTGGTDLTGNRMRENPITFSPTHTLVLTANDEPSLTDAAVRARVRLIPCEADPDEVRDTRAAIGHVNGPAWQAEAPGVLAAMMREAGRWLADARSAGTAAAPAVIRYRAEELAAEQDPVRSWLEGETEPYEPGMRANDLYKAFVGWCRDNGLRSQPTSTRWGRALTEHGYPPEKRRDANYRKLRIRADHGWLIPGTPVVDGSVEARGQTIAEPPTEDPPRSTGVFSDSVDSVDSSLSISRSSSSNTYKKQNIGVIGVGPQTHHRDTQKVASDLQKQARGGSDEHTTHAPQAADAVKPPPKPGTKAWERLEAKRTKLAEAAGPTVPLPAVVTRDGAVRPITVDEAAAMLAQALPTNPDLTVDVENTGYPLGHRDYALRTVQIGTDTFAVDFDADDPEHRRVGSWALRAARRLHAHSATADGVPLVHAGWITEAEFWDRMHDTVIPAKLADPASTGSDPGLKKLAAAVLGDAAVSPAADDARAALFKAGGWLTDTKVTTPVTKSGWAQVDRGCETMIRYAASDVLDDAALAKALPAVPAQLLERERTAQRMTARVAHHGLRIDGEQVQRLLGEHEPARAAAAAQVRAFGVENPGSSPQVAEALTRLGVGLPRTSTGRPSVAEGVIDPLAKAEGPAGELARAVLDYRHHNTAIGLFLEPYQALVQHGDGRARPTVYTLSADTGRMSCVRPNLQQVPQQGGFRACITADPGHLLISADFSSVEVRVAAALSGDPNLRRMLAEDVDLHGEIARMVFGPGATKAHRYIAKRVVFGRIYGGGIPTLAAQAGVPEPTAAAAVAALDAMLPGLAEWSRQTRSAVEAGRTQFPSYAGRVIHLPQQYPHKAPNYCIQGTARELLIDALMRWKTTRWGNAILLPVHDEVIAMVPEAEADEATATLVQCMQTDLYGVHIAAEASAPSYAWQDAA